MPDDRELTVHYSPGDLLKNIEAGVRAMGRTPKTITIDELASVDEFHIGGREASEAFLSQLALSERDRVLDVGSGLGGGARWVAQRYGARVTGIDLTPEFVEVGRALCEWVGLEEQVELHAGSALAMPFSDDQFDAAYIMHVGMNIAEKPALMRELGRVLRRSSRIGIYDVMRTGPGELAFPVPWATRPEDSAVDSPDAYRAALEAAGFTVTAERDRRDFAIAFFDAMRERAASADGPPPLGLHLLLGETRAQKMENVVANIRAGRLAPVEIIAERG